MASEDVFAVLHLSPQPSSSFLPSPFNPPPPSSLSTSSFLTFLLFVFLKNSCISLVCFSFSLFSFPFPSCFSHPSVTQTTFSPVCISLSRVKMLVKSHWFHSLNNAWINLTIHRPVNQQAINIYGWPLHIAVLELALLCSDLSREFDHLSAETA